MPKRTRSQTVNKADSKVPKLTASKQEAEIAEEEKESLYIQEGAVLHFDRGSVSSWHHDEERKRVDSGEGWRRWGPYLSERQWGTVREDLSQDGSCWDYFPHSDAIWRSYCYGEDGLFGICDDQARLCLSLALWNGQDEFLKERLFGLTGPQGNHGEDVKELYYYLDSTPTHSYMRALYKYPQNAFPYQKLLDENTSRKNDQPEYEIMDTGVFDDNAYWDVFAEYAKSSPTDILCQYTIHNRSRNSATIHVLPTVWLRILGLKELIIVFHETKDPKQFTERQAYKFVKKTHNGLFGSNINTWMRPSVKEDNDKELPVIKEKQDSKNTILCSGGTDIGEYCFSVEESSDQTEISFLYTNNETNIDKLNYKDSQLFPEFFRMPSEKFYKDGINNYVVNECKDAVNPSKTGTKAAALVKLTIEPGQHAVVRCRLYSNKPTILNTKKGKSNKDLFGKKFIDIMQKRKTEADKFYKMVCGSIEGDRLLVMKQALAGLCWSKQFFCFNGRHVQENFMRSFVAKSKSNVTQNKSKSIQDQKIVEEDSETVVSSLSYDPSSDFSVKSSSSEGESQSYVSRRNSEWPQLLNSDIISMPDKWEFPWYATWDLAFHLVPFGLVDIHFAKSQLLLFLSDRYLHPKGQLPAYEFNFSDVNPPVHAWACLKVYRLSLSQGDNKEENIQFLKKCFNKLVVNFTWWVNKKDRDGSFLFEGGFLGMDNISCLHRSELPEEYQLKQADGTAWMGLYSLCMLDMALELAQTDKAFEDMAIMYLTYFSHIVNSINGPQGLWNSMDKFFYDRLIDKNNKSYEVRIRCMIGLTCLFPVLLLTEDRYRTLPAFTKHLNSVLSSVTRGRMNSLRDAETKDGKSEKVLLSLVSESQMCSLLQCALDEDELLSIYGIRALSKAYSGENGYKLITDDSVFTVSYCPGESNSSMFGGNSNWRGPIWLCMNYLLLESLDIFGSWFGNSVKIPLPTKSSNLMSLNEVTLNVRRRLVTMFTASNIGVRPAHGKFAARYATDRHFNDLVLFYEYFNGDNGAGCGASHQTGWTALVANLIHQIQNQENQNKQKSS